MGHWCKICGRMRANEKFSGKGHQQHICKQCSQLPRAEREAIEHEQEIFGYLSQAKISKKNLSRLKKLAASANAEIAELAQIALAVGRVKPGKRGRLKFLAQHHRHLLEQLEESGLIVAHYEGWR